MKSPRIKLLGRAAGAAAIPIFAVLLFAGWPVVAWSQSFVGNVTRALGNSPGCGIPGGSHARDSAGHIVVTGCASNGRNLDMVTYKLNGTTGAVIWKASYNGSADADDAGHAVGIASNGDVVVTGYSTDLSGGQNIRTVVYSGQSGLELRSFAYVQPLADRGRAILVSGTTAYVTGFTTNGTFGQNIVTIAYDINFGEAWTQRFDGDGNGQGAQVGNAISRHPATGAIVVTGSATEVLGGLNIRTIKYDSGGTRLWSAMYRSAGSGEDVATSVRFDAAGNVYVAGHGTDGAAGKNMRVIKYLSADGSQAWTTIHAGTANGADVALALALDASSSRVTVTGCSVEVATGTVMRTMSLNASDGSTVWNVAHAMGGNACGHAVAVDPSGDVYVTGMGTDATAGVEMKTIKYAALTGAEIWTARYGESGSGADQGLAVMADAAGVVVTGYSTNAKGLQAIVTRKYDAGTGALIWSGLQPPTWAFTSLAPFSSRPLAMGPTGKVAWTGYQGTDDGDAQLTIMSNENGSHNAWGSGGGAPMPSRGIAAAVGLDGTFAMTGFSAGLAGDTDMRTIKFDANGTSLWSVAFAGTAGLDDQGQAIAMDGAGNVFITGFSTDVSGGRNMRTFKYAATTGAVLWTSVYSGNALSADEGVAMAVDAAGHAVVAGYSTDADGGINMRTIKYDGATGAELWNVVYSGAAGQDDRANTLVLDGAGNVLVGGRSVESGAGAHMRIIKYSGATGAIIWSAAGAPSPLTDGVAAIAIDASGNVGVTGTQQGCNPGDAGAADICTMKFDGTNGALLWRAAYDGPFHGVDEGRGIAVDAKGHFHVAGFSINAAGESKRTLLKYEGVTGAPIWAQVNTASGIDDGSYRAVVVTPANVIRTLSQRRVYGRAAFFTLQDLTNADIPTAPGIGTATPGVGRVLVAFTPPIYVGGAAIIDYTATCGTRTATSNTSPIEVVGLDAVPTTCTVTARSAEGTSLPSAASSAVTPALGYRLIVNVVNDTGGSVTSDLPGIDCGDDCDDSYSPGTVVTLTANPVPGMRFSAWTNATCPGGNAGRVCAIQMTGWKYATAKFVAGSPIATNDTDGDGRSDLLWYNTATGLLYGLPMNAVTPGSGAVIDQQTDPAWTLAAAADLNADYKTDVVWYNTLTGEVYGLLLNGSTVLAEGTLYVEPDINWKIVGAGDFNGDGKADLLWRNTVTGDVFMLLLDGLGVVSGGVIYSEPNLNWVIQKVADFNGDGRADIVWRNTATGDVFMMLMNGTSVVGGGVIYSEPNTAWQIQAAADFNGDGKADLLWRNVATGDVFMMLMNGTTVTGGSVFYAEPNAAWKIVATGDYNGNSKADIVWRNTETGQVYLMLMNGATIVQGAFVYTEPDQNWKILGP